MAVDHDIRVLRLLDDDLVFDREDPIDHRRIDVAVAHTTALFRVLVRRVEEDSCIDAAKPKHVRPLDDQRLQRREVQRPRHESVRGIVHRRPFHTVAPSEKRLDVRLHQLEVHLVRADVSEVDQPVFVIRPRRAKKVVVLMDEPRANAARGELTSERHGRRRLAASRLPRHRDHHPRIARQSEAADHHRRE